MFPVSILTFDSFPQMVLQAVCPSAMNFRPKSVTVHTSVRLLNSVVWGFFLLSAVITSVSNCSLSVNLTLSNPGYNESLLTSHGTWSPRWHVTSAEKSRVFYPPYTLTFIPKSLYSTVFQPQLSSCPHCFGKAQEAVAVWEAGEALSLISRKEHFLTSGTLSHIPAALLYLESLPFSEVRAIDWCLNLVCIW